MNHEEATDTHDFENAAGGSRCQFRHMAKRAVEVSTPTGVVALTSRRCSLFADQHASWQPPLPPVTFSVPQELLLQIAATLATHVGHFDMTGRSGLGCPVCVHQRILRDQLNAVLA